MIRKYVRYQEKKEQQLEQLQLVRLEIVIAAQLTWPAPSGGRALSPLWGDFPKPHP